MLNRLIHLLFLSFLYRVNFRMYLGLDIQSNIQIDNKIHLEKFLLLNYY